MTPALPASVESELFRCEHNRCKHDMLPETCAFCNGQVTAANQTRIYGGTERDPQIKARRISMPETQKNKGPCSQVGCAKPAVVRGMCQVHYLRYRKDLNKNVTPKEGEVKPETKEPLAEEALEKKTHGGLLVLDLSEYPTIEEGLQAAAKRQFRTVSGQAMQCISAWLEWNKYLSQ